MEPLKTKIILGEFPITDIKYDAIKIQLGNKVGIWIHIGDFPHNLKPGQTLTLFTEIQYAFTKPAPIE